MERRPWNCRDAMFPDKQLAELDVGLARRRRIVCQLEIRTSDREQSERRVLEQCRQAIAPRLVEPPLLDREAPGLDVMAYVHVRLSSQGRDALAQFERAVRDRPEVLDCCTLTGEWDFCLRIVTHDMKEYEAFFLDHLSKIPHVQSVNASIVVTVIKESTELPLARA